MSVRRTGMSIGAWSRSGAQGIKGQATRRGTLHSSFFTLHSSHSTLDTSQSNSRTPGVELISSTMAWRSVRGATPDEALALAMMARARTMYFMVRGTVSKQLVVRSGDYTRSGAPYGTRHVSVI